MIEEGTSDTMLGMQKFTNYAHLQTQLQLKPSILNWTNSLHIRSGAIRRLNICFQLSEHMYSYSVYYFIPLTYIGAGMDVIIEGDWYEPVEFSPLGLAQVEYSPNFENESCGFLRDSESHNYTLWPSDPYGEYKKTGRTLTEVDRTPGRRYCVIAHGVGETFDLEADRNTEPELILPTEPTHAIFRDQDLEVLDNDNDSTDGKNKQTNKRTNSSSSSKITGKKRKPNRPKSNKGSKKSSDDDESDSEDDEEGDSDSDHF